MRTIHAAAATLASAALLGATTEPTHERCLHGHATGPARPGPPPARASRGARRGERRSGRAARARRHALPRAADGVGPQALLPRKPARARSADVSRPHARATGARRLVVTAPVRALGPRRRLLGARVARGAARGARRARSRPAAACCSARACGRRRAIRWGPRPTASSSSIAAAPGSGTRAAARFGRARHLDGRRVGGIAASGAGRAAGGCASTAPAACDRASACRTAGPSTRAPARCPPTDRCSRWPPTASGARTRRGSRSCTRPTAPWSFSRRLCPPRAASSRGRRRASGSTCPSRAAGSPHTGRATGASSHCRFGWPTT